MIGRPHAHPLLRRNNADRQPQFPIEPKSADIRFWQKAGQAGLFFPFVASRQAVEFEARLAKLEKAVEK